MQDKFAKQATAALEAAWEKSADMTPVFHILRDRHRSNAAAVRFVDEMLSGEGVTAYAAILAYKRSIIDETLGVRLVGDEYVIAGRPA